jgi:DNA-directed RNA polymerase specialized sigma24 family protein
MTARVFLGQYKAALAGERQLWAQIDELKERAARVNAQWGGTPVQGSPGDKMALLDAAIDKERVQLAAAILRTQNIRRRVVSAINALPDPQGRELLTYRYINALTWEAIAEKMQCDRSTVFRLHGKFLQKVATV